MRWNAIFGVQMVIVVVPDFHQVHDNNIMSASNFEIQDHETVYSEQNVVVECLLLLIGVSKSINQLF